MSGTEIRTVLLDKLAASRGCTRDALECDIAATGIIDSLEGVELIIMAEEAYGIIIPDGELTSEVCRDINGIIRVIQSRIHSGQ